MAGYGTRWYNEPECKTIVFSAPAEVTEGIDIQDCKQDDEMTVCPVKYPRYVLNIKEYQKDIENGKATRTYLNNCIEVINQYNMDKK